MLDLFAVFTRGGALLWTLQFTAAMRHNPVDALNALIKSCLLEERSAETTYTYVPKAGAHQALKWTFHNGLGLVFVAVYQKALSLMYVDELLAAAKAEFVANHYKPNVYSYPGFNETFQRLLRDAESRAEEAKKGGSRALQQQQQQQLSSKAAQSIHGAAAKGGRAGKTSSSSAAAANGIKGGGGSGDDEEGDAAAGANGAAHANGVSGAAGAALGGASDEHSAGHSAEEDGGANSRSSAFDLSKLPKGLSASKGSRGRGGGKAGGGGPPSQAPSGRLGAKAAEEAKQKQGEGGKKPKAERKWGLRGASGADASKLDFSDRDPHHSEYTAGSESDRQGFSDVDGPNGNRFGSSTFIGESLMDRDEDDAADDVVKSLEEQELLSNGKGGAASAPKASAASKGLLGSFVSSLALRVVGKQALSAEDLAPALADMKRKLMERNVAEEIAQNICDSVARSLEGQKLASFTGVGAFVARAVEDALAGILNKRTVDMLLDIRKAQERGRPYVVVFCGVNGVGKSTNLAKIAYWLGQHNVKVLIAACDTFRAGAVEQLKTHCTRLQVPLYERGYEKDPAKVAAEAIKQAEREGRHVVLVDTAGRMQDNEPLMRALSSLINVNNPNLVLFVGEALVGNDAVDQLVKFNRALHDLAPPTATVRHVIDGIVLTKFDTIDDKVGAAVSMVYASGAPIMFLGCGQTYADLKRLNVKAVVNALLK